MTAAKYHSSAPDRWVMPRWKDPAGAYHRHGPLQPMPKQPRKGWLARLRATLAQGTQPHE